MPVSIVKIPSNPKSLTIIVPVKNANPTDLEITLKSIKGKKVIMLLNKEDVNPKYIELAKKYGVNYYIASGTNKSEDINEIIDKVDTEYVMFLHPGDYIPENYLEKFYDADIICPNCLIPTGENWHQKFEREIAEDLAKSNYGIKYATTYLERFGFINLALSGLIVRTTLIKTHKLKPHYAEDTEFCFRVMKKENIKVAVHDLHIYKKIPDNMLGIIKRTMRWTKGALEIEEKRFKAVPIFITVSTISSLVIFLLPWVFSPFVAIPINIATYGVLSKISKKIFYEDTKKSSFVIFPYLLLLYLIPTSISTIKHFVSNVLRKKEKMTIKI
jgi:cellulose synthase/poly-beta-1,6-N-acetylglucosamine synthase-like glycosyltransferase